MVYQGFKMTAMGEYCSFYSYSPREAPLKHLRTTFIRPRRQDDEHFPQSCLQRRATCTHYPCLHTNLTSQPSHILGFSCSPNYFEDHLTLHRLLVPKQPNMQVTFSFFNTWTQTGHKKNHRLHFLHHYCPQTHQKQQEGGGRKGCRINYHNKNGKGHQIF